MSKAGSVFLMAAALTVVGCGGSSGEGQAQQATPEFRRATAWLNPTAESETSGSAIFIREGDKVTVQVSIEGATPGVHACHIHQVGDCSAEDGSSAGGHWNPSGHDHGEWGADPFHLGDIGNIEVGENGEGSLTLTTDLWALGGGVDNDIIERGIIIHADADDFTSQPTGAAGGRVACGVIRGDK